MSIKKSLMAMGLSVAMLATSFTGFFAGEASAATAEGGVLNIYCWNDEFPSRMLYYPGFTPTVRSDVLKGGKIGTTKVKFTVVTSEDGMYQDNLEAKLTTPPSNVDDRADIFLVESDYSAKYVNSNYTMNVKDLGITDADMKNQFDYTKEVMTTSDGAIKGLSWQICPSVLIYNRDVAKAVLGSEKPADVQKYVKDWTTFYSTAAKMSNKNYLMTASVIETYRTYEQNKTLPWVKSDRVYIDKNLETWAKKTRVMVDKNQTQNIDLWSGYADFTTGNNVFCSFGPEWLYKYIFGFWEKNPNSSNVAERGRLGVCPGPENTFWGGSWICVNPKTDNKTLCKKVLKYLTCDTTIMTNIANGYGEAVNNKVAMQNYTVDNNVRYMLGGQNPVSVLVQAAENIHLSNCTQYDLDIEDCFRLAFMDYFSGALSYTEAIESFHLYLKDWNIPVKTGFALSRTNVTLATNKSTTIYPTRPDVTWKSSDESVATVDANGKIKALRYGTAIITAKTKDGKHKASCTVNVKFYDVAGSSDKSASNYQYYYNPVYWAAEKGITLGYDKVYFGVGEKCTRAAVTIFLWRAAGKPTPKKDASAYFSDLGAYSASSDTNKAIAWAYEKGIVKGNSGQFSPLNTITRKGFMIMLYRYAGKPSVTGTLKFTDCAYDKTSETYKAILWGSSKGITSGYSDGTFKPDASCLREQIITFIYRYAK